MSNLREALQLYFEDQPFPGHVDTPILPGLTSRVSPSLPIVSGRDVVRALAKVGFLAVSQRGCRVKLRS